MNKYEPGGRPPEENTVRRLAELPEPGLRAALAFVRQAGPHSLHIGRQTDAPGVLYPTLFLRLIVDAVGFSAAGHWAWAIYTYDVPAEWGASGEADGGAPLSALGRVCFELDLSRGGQELARNTYGERAVGDWQAYTRRGIDDLCARMGGRVWPDLERLIGKALEARAAASRAGVVERRVEALQAQVTELQGALTQVSTALGWLLRTVPRTTWARGGPEVVERVGELADGMAAWPGEAAAEGEAGEAGEAGGPGDDDGNDDGGP